MPKIVADISSISYISIYKDFPYPIILIWVNMILSLIFRRDYILKSLQFNNHADLFRIDGEIKSGKDFALLL